MASALIPRRPGLLELSDVSGYSQRQPAKTIVWQTVQKHWQAYRGYRRPWFGHEVHATFRVLFAERLVGTLVRVPCQGSIDDRSLSLGGGGTYSPPSPMRLVSLPQSRLPPVSTSTSP